MARAAARWRDQPLEKPASRGYLQPMREGGLSTPILETPASLRYLEPGLGNKPAIKREKEIFPPKFGVWISCRFGCQFSCSPCISPNPRKCLEIFNRSKQRKRR